MRKLILSALVAIGMLTSIHSMAQAPTIPYYVYFYYDANNCVCTSTNVAITTSQQIGLGGPVYTFTESAPGGSYSNPLGQFSYGGYWDAPSFFYPVSVIINSGYTATVKNNAPGPQKLRMLLQFFWNGPDNAPHLVYGPYTTIPGYSSAALTIPAGSYTYTSALGSYNPSSSIPIPLVIDVAD